MSAAVKTSVSFISLNWKKHIKNMHVQKYIYFLNIKVFKEVRHTLI